MQIFKPLVNLVLILIVALPRAKVFAGEPNTKNTVKLEELVFPSELKELSQAPGSVYFTPYIKNKVLIPIHIWGSVGTSGLHYLPSGITFVKALSIAGGPQSNADLSNVKITRELGHSLKEYSFNVKDGGDIEAKSFVMKPGDTIFVGQSTFYINRGYYTSLIGIVATILGTVLIYRQVQNR